LSKVVLIKSDEIILALKTRKSKHGAVSYFIRFYLYSLTEFYHIPANIIKNGSRMNRPPKRNTSEPCI